MKSPDQISELLKNFEKKFGFKIHGHQPGSEVWFQAKLGVISASNAFKVVAKKDSETRHTYMCDLVAEVCTGVYEEINSRHMDWGRQHEDAARSYYEFSTGLSVTTLPFVFKDETYRIGCSPDGTVNEKKGAEIKCPWDTSNYIKFLVADSIKPEWKWQHNFTMWTMDAEEWDFCQYDPRMKKTPMSILTAKRDPEKIKVIEDMVPKFIEDMDLMLAQIGVGFGEQWRRLADLPPATKQHHNGDYVLRAVIGSIGNPLKSVPLNVLAAFVNEMEFLFGRQPIKDADLAEDLKQTKLFLGAITHE